MQKDKVIAAIRDHIAGLDKSDVVRLMIETELVLAESDTRTLFELESMVESFQLGSPESACNARA